MEALTKASCKLVSIATLQRWMTRARLDGPTAVAEATYLAARRREIPRAIKRQIVSHLLNNKRTTVSLETAIAIEHVLNVEPGTIFVDTPFPVSQTRTRRAA